MEIVKYQNTFICIQEYYTISNLIDFKTRKLKIYIVILQI
jgi:hypothetical protein